MGFESNPLEALKGLYYNCYTNLTVRFVYEVARRNLAYNILVIFSTSTIGISL